MLTGEYPHNEMSGVRAIADALCVNTSALTKSKHSPYQIQLSTPRQSPQFAHQMAPYRICTGTRTIPYSLWHTDHTHALTCLVECSALHCINHNHKDPPCTRTLSDIACYRYMCVPLSHISDLQVESANAHFVCCLTSRSEHELKPRAPLHCRSQSCLPICT